MKRKIFSFAAALTIAACSILPVSAAGTGSRYAHRFHFSSGFFCPIVCPQAPEQNQTPSVPNKPEQDTNQNTMSQLEQTACELVNAERRANGLAPLTISSDLSVKARIKSADMKENRYFSHNSPTYGSPFTMMKTLGITYRSAGENIAMNYKTASAVVAAWMASPSHRANILSANYTTMGIGYVNGYWTQWFIG